MKWRQTIEKSGNANPNCVESDKGYRVAKYRVGVEDKYVPWYRDERLADKPHSSFESARAVCEDHHAARS